MSCYQCNATRLQRALFRSETLCRSCATHRSCSRGPQGADHSSCSRPRCSIHAARSRLGRQQMGCSCHWPTQVCQQGLRSGLVGLTASHSNTSGPIPVAVLWYVFQQASLSLRPKSTMVWLFRRRPPRIQLPAWKHSKFEPTSESWPGDGESARYVQLSTEECYQGVQLVWASLKGRKYYIPTGGV